MKSKFILIAAVAASLFMPSAVEAIDLRIDLGDRGYYNHGPRYFRGDYEYIWVPGRRDGRHWRHGYYRRGERRHRFHRGYDHRDRY